MLDLRAELNALGIPFEPIGWVKAPAYPYGVFDDVSDYHGTDLPSRVAVIKHSVTVTAYHSDYDQILIAGEAIEGWARARGLDYRARVQYIDDEGHYSVTLTTTITEKKGMR